MANIVGYSGYRTELSVSKRFISRMSGANSEVCFQSSRKDTDPGS